ncbi:hypothetical protein BGW39_011665 [Mortierella sp. 14UC]|nr:hypothetical protein BGW39_011665 [Mortierella sp. 14UC]
MLYRKDVYAKNLALFKTTRASGSTISRAISQAWKREPEFVKRKFEYEAELERVRQQGQTPLAYEYRKRKSDIMTAGGVGSSGKGKGSGSNSASTAANKTKNKNSKAVTKGAGTSRSSSSASGSGSMSGSGRMLVMADFSGPSSLGCGLGSLALSSSPSSSLKLLSVQEGVVVGSGSAQDAHAERSYSNASQEGDDVATLISTTGDGEARNRARRTKSSASTTSNIAANAAAAVAKTRQRSKSECGTVVNGAKSGHTPHNYGRDTYAEVLPSDGAFATMQIQEAGTTTVAGQDVTMLHHPSQPHLYHDKGEQEGVDGDDDNNKSEGAVALREDRAPIKKRKSFLDHHKK